MGFQLQCSGCQDLPEDEIFDYELWLIQQTLAKTQRKQLKDFPDMPVPERDWEGVAENSFISEQLNYDRNHERSLAEERLAQLNPEQLDGYQQIISSVETQSGQTFFLNGPGGTGKTFVYNTVCNTVRSHGWIVLCVASSGIASLLLSGGRTAHSMFKIPLSLNPESTCPIHKEGPLAALMRNTRLIIWDEITMQHQYAAEAVDRTCRDLLDTPDQPFGGITIVFGGDFQQILPVVPQGSREDIVSATLLRSDLWKHIKVLKLIQNMRVADTPDAHSFSSWLLKIGHGCENMDNAAVQLPHEMIASDIITFVDKIYHGIQSSPPLPPDYFLNRMILSPRNSDVADLNAQILDMMPGDAESHLSIDSVVDEAGVDDGIPGSNIPPKFLRTLNSSNLPLGDLQLKLGCPLILLRNLCPTRGLCNGTQMILVQMSRCVLEVRLIGGEHDGQLALIPRITLSPTEAQTGFAFVLKRRQFPVRLTFALTINKAQGQSVKHVGIDLHVPVFSHGQLYVALSRATSSRNVQVLLPEEDRDNHRTQNIVYPEVLVDTVGLT